MNCVTRSGPGCPRGVGSASKSVLKGLLKGQSGETWGRDPCVIMGEGGRKGKGPKEFPLPRPWGQDLCKQNASLTVVPGEGGAHRPPRFPARPMTRMESSTVLADFRGEPESDNCSPPWEVLSGLRGVFETSWCGGQPACPRAGPSRASLGVTVVAMGQPAVQQTSVGCNLLHVHLCLSPASKWWQTDILGRNSAL